MAQRLEAEYLAAHPEIYVDEHGVHHNRHEEVHVPVHVPVHHVEVPHHVPVHHVEVPHHVPVHHVEEVHVPATSFVIPHGGHHEHPEHHEHHVEHPHVYVQAPEEDEEVKIARAQHLAEVERLTQEHYAALAAAPPNVE